MSSSSAKDRCDLRHGLWTGNVINRLSEGYPMGRIHPDKHSWPFGDPGPGNPDRVDLREWKGSFAPVWKQQGGVENESDFACGCSGPSARRAVAALPHARNSSHAGRKTEPIGPGAKNGGRQAGFIRSLGEPRHQILL